MNINQEWVDSLQVGDKVAIDIGRYGNRQYAITNVAKITPKRRISTSNGMLFKPDGLEYGKGGSWALCTRLEPVTDEIKDIIERSHLVAKIKKVKMEDLTTEELRNIFALVKDKGANVQ